MHGAGRVPEEFAVANVVTGGVLKVFEREPMQVVRSAHQVRIERAEHPQDADRLFTPCVEAFDFIVGQWCAGSAIERGESVMPNSAEQMAMQFDFRNRVKE